MKIQTASEGEDPAKRLLALRLTVEALHQSVLTGYEAASSCTPHEPRSYPGTTVWARGVGHLRDLLVPQGWRPDSAANYETVVHPSGTHAVALAAGTYEVGLHNGIPRTRNPKGRATEWIIMRNQLRMIHPAFGDDVDLAFAPEADRDTWLLLHYYDSKLEEIRSELSLPWEMSGSTITAWRERILLSPIPYSGIVDELPDPDEPEDEIDVDVSRRPD